MEKTQNLKQEMDRTMFISHLVGIFASKSICQSTLLHSLTLPGVETDMFPAIKRYK